MAPLRQSCRFVSFGRVSRALLAMVCGAACCLLLACAPAPEQLILHERADVSKQLAGLRNGRTTTTLYVEHPEWGTVLAVHLFADPLNENGYRELTTGEIFRPTWHWLPAPRGKAFDLSWGHRLRASGLVRVDGAALEISGEVECLELTDRPLFMPITFVHPDWAIGPGDVRLRPVGEWGQVTLEQVMPHLRKAEEGRFPFDAPLHRRFLPELRVNDPAHQREIIILPRWGQGFQLQGRTLDVLLFTRGEPGQRIPFHLRIEFNQVAPHD